MTTQNDIMAKLDSIERRLDESVIERIAVSEQIAKANQKRIDNHSKELSALGVNLNEIAKLVEKLTARCDSKEGSARNQAVLIAQLIATMGAIIAAIVATFH